MQIKFKALYDTTLLPYKTHDTDAAYDVVATSKEDLGDGRIKYGLGFALQLPAMTKLNLRPRSSIHKTGLILSNCIGLGDEGYRGEYMAVFYHVIPTLPAYEVGDRILQIEVEQRNNLEFEVVNELTDTTRNTGGFGSTGN